MNVIPFTERKTPLRGALDLATGCYPAFLFGGSVGRLLPVFHFHDVNAGYLEPYLMYLDENGYKTVCMDEITRLARDGISPGKRSVALCFDDAWASLWTVVFPMLKRFNFKAIAFVAPGLTPDAQRLRAVPGEHPAVGEDKPEMATWPELRAMQSSGVVDVQAHTMNHAMIFCGNRPEYFVTPEYSPPDLAAPLVNDGMPPRFLTADDLGAPVFPLRSRCSDARRYYPAPAAVQACREYVKDRGGTDYCAQSGWDKPLRTIMEKAGGRFETRKETEQAIKYEIGRAREELNARLDADIRHICFPWAVAGYAAEQTARQAGFITAFADRLFGKRAVRAGNNPYRLMRLKHKFIFALPGRHRRWFFGS